MSEKNFAKTNPKAVASVVRKQTFIINNELAPSKIDEGDYLLGLYSHFSRFTICIINADKKAATANIPINDMLDIIRRSKKINNSFLEKQYAQSNNINKADQTKNGINENLSCYTIKITSGKLKGKTPAEVLLTDDKNIELLRNQYEWLKNNLKKYPKNKLQMDAITEAINLYKAGKLNPSQIQESKEYMIINIGIRPLIRKKREDGKCPVYEASITYKDDDYPVEIGIKNYYAPYIKNADGTINVTVKEASDLIKNTMNLSMKEWMNIIHLIEANIRGFENVIFSTQFKLANEMAIENNPKNFENE